MPILSKSDKLRYCAGCHCDFYNGKNPYNVKECWSLDKAKLVLKKKVSMSQVPPWNQVPVKVLDCYREDGFVFVDPKINC
jgi:hypothetical protein